MTAERSEAEQLEKIKVRVYPSGDRACEDLAGEIAGLIRGRQEAGRPCVLGLATGSTPVRLYRRLIALHRDDGLSFANVITFNLDEYHGLEPDHPESYARFMREQLFDHVDLPARNTHVPSGTVPRTEVFDYCREYERKIAEAGGIDLQILGIGRTGHIGFNEPGSGRDSRTRLVTLDALTRRDAARDFRGEDNVPRYAITMGVGTILDARKVVLLAWGEGKARVIQRSVEEPPSDSIPASFLQNHEDIRFLTDHAAASRLTRFRHPWRVRAVDWTPRMIRHAVVWLAARLKKPILKLQEADYSENSLGDLLTAHGPAYDLNIRVFNETQHTITGWPGGKPDADDTNRPERREPFPKRSLVFSPEPMLDVRWLGGTLNRLAAQSHAVHVVYQTSGNLAVPDESVHHAAELICELAESRQIAPQPEDGLTAFAGNVRRQLREKGLYDLDPPEIRRFKGLVRRSEARSALRTCGVPAESIRFLDLPFYEEGRYRRFEIGDKDVEQTARVLDEIRPHQIFATGSATDPSSLEAICFEILRRALESLGDAPWKRDCRIWLYAGGDREWDVHAIDMAVPLSPGELHLKEQAIYQHQSQRSQIPRNVGQKSDDPRIEEWRQEIAMNRKTARTYDNLGLAEYEAIEAFRLWGG